MGRCEIRLRLKFDAGELVRLRLPCHFQTSKQRQDQSELRIDLILDGQPQWERSLSIYLALVDFPRCDWEPMDPSKCRYFSHLIFYK